MSGVGVRPSRRRSVSAFSKASRRRRHSDTDIALLAAVVAIGKSSIPCLVLDRRAALLSRFYRDSCLLLLFALTGSKEVLSPATYNQESRFSN